MIKLSFDEQQITVPESWSDIRLGDYERWFRADPQDKMEQVKLVADICRIDPETLLENPTQVFDVICDTVKFVFRDYDGVPSERLLLDDVEYLITCTNELTLAEWVDVEAVFESESESRLSDILSILCRPQGEAYDSKVSEGRKEMFRNLAMDKVLPLLAFFLLRKERLQTVSNLYSEVKELADQYLHLTHNFVENGDGTKLLPIWQRIKFFFLTKYLKRQLSKCLDFSSIV